ncbi:hypothetical protein AM1_1696 [Acaryochloris marina MBIC11017]|uniref:Uncharacterized protein n=1 Tax=Acaryochloris marina (strain MBIC 11017) TaxID=329726 RepID=B0CB78_ACAM1|nr:hypothetical protein AM1_1696 [Acaryochloris marina MBIC11017]
MGKGYIDAFDFSPEDMLGSLLPEFTGNSHAQRVHTCSGFY